MNIKPLDVLHKYYGYTSFRKGQENIQTKIKIIFIFLFTLINHL